MEEKTFFNGRWKVVEEIGKGTTGTVYKVVNSRGGVTSYSAIKEILLPKEKKEILNMYSQGATDSDITEYFENKANEWIAKEVNFLEQFKGNPNIVAIEDHDVVEREDMLGRVVVIRMELLETLEDYILTHEVTDKEILKMALSVLNALIDCEERNVLHRDIKPQNVFVNRNNIFKLGDFSESKEIEQTVSNMTQRGTPNYMAPELYKGERGSKSIDTYSLGIMLYQYFNNNRLPFMPEKYKFEDAQKVLEKRMSGEELPSPKNASEELSNIILKACSYKPEDRYKSAMEFKEDLEKIYNKINNPKVLFGKKQSISENESEENRDENKTVGIYSDRKEAPIKSNKSKIQFGEELEEKEEETVKEEITETVEELKRNNNETVGIFYESSKPVQNKQTPKKKQFGEEAPIGEKVESTTKERKPREIEKQPSPKKEKTTEQNENKKEEKKKWSTGKKIGIGFCIVVAIFFLLKIIDGANKEVTKGTSDTLEITEIRAQDIASVTDSRGIILYIGRDNCEYCEMFVPELKKAAKQLEYDNLYYLDLGKIYDVETGAVLDKEAESIMKNLEYYDTDSLFPEYVYNPSDFGTTPMTLLVADSNIRAALVGFNYKDDIISFFGPYSLTIKYGNYH